MTSKVLALILSATIVGGLSDSGVILANETGLPIARIEIDNRTIEAIPGLPQHDGKILISVAKGKHDFKVVFRGGAIVRWPQLDFSGVHEIWLQRNRNNFEIRVQ